MLGFCLEQVGKLAAIGHLGTGQVEGAADLTVLGALAAEVTARAVVNAVLCAHGLTLPDGQHLPAARDQMETR